MIKKYLILKLEIRKNFWQEILYISHIENNNILNNSIILSYVRKLSMHLNINNLFFDGRLIRNLLSEMKLFSSFMSSIISKCHRDEILRKFACIYQCNQVKLIHLLHHALNITLTKYVSLGNLHISIFSQNVLHPAEINT